MLKCACCKQKIEKDVNIKYWAWQLNGEIYCSYTCYSKVFDSKYKASKFSLNANESGCKKGRVIDKGYERHGSR